MRIHNLYTDENGESHFRDIEVEWVETRRGSKLSKRFPATGVIFRQTEAEHNVDWHPAPRGPLTENLSVVTSSPDLTVVAGTRKLKAKWVWGVPDPGLSGTTGVGRRKSIGTRTSSVGTV